VLAGAVQFTEAVSVAHGAFLSLLNRQPYQVLPVHNPVNSGNFELTLFQTCGRPGFELHAQSQTARSQNFFDFIE